ncbi:MAG: cupredoxin domain-containing protein [Planctomycetes bacterium]|nr:cupredoxin domain-containing protein [Planctomycetota bacterium]
MSLKTKKHVLILAASVIVVGLLTWSGLALGIGPASEGAPRRITLIAKDVVFQLPDQPGQANPVLRLKKGQTVMLTLRNDEPERVLHCFTIGGFEVKTSRDLAAGESETLVFTPDTRGTFAYACLMHPSMAGQVVVE